VDAPAPLWWPVGLVTLGLVALALTVTYGSPRRHVASGPRRAAVLGAATGISWGFVAAVIKELSSRLGEGLNAVNTSWPLYVLIVTGAATLVLSSHALALSHSQLIADENGPASGGTTGHQPKDHRERVRR
jgi:hypothetical protein